MSVSEQFIKRPQSDFADFPPGGGIRAVGRASERRLNLLGRILGQVITVITEQEGKGLFGTEEIKLLCKRLRFYYDPELD